MKAYYYNSAYLLFGPTAILRNQIDENYAGIKLFRCVFNVFAINMTFHDRTNTITTPIRMAQVKGLELPEFKKIDKSFEELCYDRAAELMEVSKATNRKIVVMYSGGIDSTLVLVSFFKSCSDKDIRENLIVLMNGISIEENKRFYRDFVVKKVDKILNSNTFIHHVGNPNYIVVSGEGNDQLFGSMVSQGWMLKYGEDSLHKKINYGQAIEFYNNTIQDINMAEQLFCLTKRVVDKAPVPIDTPYLFFWWLNLTCKFQSVFVRSSSYTRPEYQDKITFGDNYQMFFDNSDFQLWAINNTDKLIQDSWKTYKQECKEIIYRYNKDDEYRINKTKWGSLRGILTQKRPTVIIDEHMKYHYELPMEVIEENNSFSEISC